MSKERELRDILNQASGYFSSDSNAESITCLNQAIELMPAFLDETRIGMEDNEFFLLKKFYYDHLIGFYLNYDTIGERRPELVLGSYDVLMGINLLNTEILERVIDIHKKRNDVGRVETYKAILEDKKRTLEKCSALLHEGALAQTEEEDLEKAIQKYEECLDLNPYNVEARAFLGIIFASGLAHKRFFHEEIAPDLDNYAPGGIKLIQKIEEQTSQVSISLGNEEYDFCKGMQITVSLGEFPASAQEVFKFRMVLSDQLHDVVFRNYPAKKDSVFKIYNNEKAAEAEIRVLQHFKDDPDYPVPRVVGVSRVKERACVQLATVQGRGVFDCAQSLKEERAKKELFEKCFDLFCYFHRHYQFSGIVDEDIVEKTIRSAKSVGIELSADAIAKLREIGRDFHQTQIVAFRDPNPRNYLIANPDCIVDIDFETAHKGVGIFGDLVHLSDCYIWQLTQKELLFYEGRSKQEITQADRFWAFHRNLRLCEIYSGWLRGGRVSQRAELTKDVAYRLNAAHRHLALAMDVPYPCSENPKQAISLLLSK